MKKLLKKMKKTLIATVMSIGGLTTSSFGTSGPEIPPPVTPLYGPPSDTVIYSKPILVLRIISALIIFLIGLGILLNKKISKKTKIIITIIFIIILILLMIFIPNIVINFMKGTWYD